MKKEEIFTTISNNLVSSLATIENGEPRVRGMMVYRADENGIIFHTGKNKELYKQLCNNPNVELCFAVLQENIQIRVRGKVELVNDKALKEEIIEARPFIKPWLEQYGDDLLAIYRLKNGKATTWTMETNFAPKEYISL